MEVILRRSSIFLAAIFLAALFYSQLFADNSVNVPKTIELPDEAVSKKVLENGLVLLSKEIPREDLVAINIKIMAGSSLEEEYLGSGISHLVEHMLFKGTKTRGPGVIEKEIKSYGGFMNGSVGPDLTEYSVIVPSRYAPEAVSLLKEMLLNATFDQGEFDKEKEVILKELRLDNDEPQNLLIRLLNETAYLRHAYKYPPIGYEEKFRALKRDDALRYYNRMYAPNRMVLSIVGALGKGEVLSRIETEFKDFRRPNYSVIGLTPAEPQQITRRRSEKKTETNLLYLAIGYHSTGALDEDLFAMDLLSMILGRGANSRLNNSLVKKDKITYSVSCWNYTPRDPGLFVITAVLDAGKLPEAEKSIANEMAKVRSGLVSADELESAKRMVLGDYIFGLQTADAQASDMASDYLLTGSYDFSRRYVEGVQAVTPEALRRAANKYLRDDSATIVTIVPENFNDLPKPAKPVSLAEAPVKQTVLPNGLKFVIRQNKKTPTVSITALMGGGLATEDRSDNGISNFVAEMLLKGTSTRREDQIAGAMEKLGGSINSFSGFNGFGINIECLKPDLDTAIALLQDLLMNSTFPQEEIDKERAIILAMIDEDDDDIFQRGITAVRREIFGDSPYSLRDLGEKDSVKSLSREDLIDYYKNYAIPNNMVIAISGDVDPDQVADRITKAFDGLKTKELPKTVFRRRPADKISVRTIAMQKEQSLVALGFMTTDIKDPERYSLDVLGSVLSGYSGRLFDSLRNKLSMAYTLGCVQRMMADTGFFVLYAATTKEKIQPVEKALLEQVAAIRKNGISDEELLLAKRELVCEREIKMQANGYFSQTAAVDELYGLGFDNVFKYAALIGKVTKEDVKRVVDKYLDPKSYSEVIVAGE